MESYQSLLNEFEKINEENENLKNIIINLNNNINNLNNNIIKLELSKEEEKKQFENNIIDLNNIIDNLKNELEEEKRKDKIKELIKINDELKEYYEMNILTENNPFLLLEEYNNINNTIGQNKSLLNVINNNIKYIKNICYPCEDNEMKDEEQQEEQQI